MPCIHYKTQGRGNTVTLFHKFLQYYYDYDSNENEDDYNGNNDDYTGLQNFENIQIVIIIIVVLTIIVAITHSIMACRILCNTSPHCNNTCCCCQGEMEAQVRCFIIKIYHYNKYEESMRMIKFANPAVNTMVKIERLDTLYFFNCL